MENEDAVIPLVNVKLGTVSKGLEKDPERIGNKRTSRDQPNYNIVKNKEISWRLEKTCCLSDSNKSLPADASVKKLAMK